mmetsp:Transcript_45523/g.75902  ORF Transcript_45523/g.75902 Transcript_45523/m.75902 type:complete len:203 (-) Transcript_45523:283-891(-)|eukprot:CAMPEP_0198209774 /NCGR_PEP_ID=MMETSP1445-20131203/17723_1 /TAXON_ID=36898 /ORGANISM="Pyramimonas sp., Strain CCMP2087" /LENGTH=202 /DNA_ID=CAMNT_0043883653 /DNA_START=219 /DNA_END=827 /DNA_ORIENTATION=-
MGYVEYELSPSAYVKVMLHVMKYPSLAVNGVLVGPKIATPSGEEPVKASVVDAVPLFHGQLSLAPLTEIALTQVESYFAEKGLCIIGYYHANERLGDADFGSVARKIADRIFANCPNSCALLVDTDKLEKLMTTPTIAVKLFTRAGPKWRSAESGDELKLSAPSTLSILADYLGENRHKRICDFGEHLEDLTRDWLNPNIMD